MKRKVIQIAESTQLISLPRKWAKEHNVKKGDELDVQEEGNSIIIKVQPGEEKVETAILDVTKAGGMLQRCIDALYIKGVDEIKIIYGAREQFDEVLKAVSRTTIGFEVIEQGESYCVIKNVSGYLEEFDSLLRRCFLLTLSMADDGISLIKSRQYAQLSNLLPLEATNNRLTIVCRRMINKGGRHGYKKIGPLYSVVSELESVADLYKYAFTYMIEHDKPNVKIRNEVIELYKNTNDLLRQLYQRFYKFDLNDVAKFKETRNDIVNKAHRLFKAKLQPEEIVLLHQLLTITTIVFEVHVDVMAMFI